MSLTNLLQLLEYRLEEAKIWKKIIEKPVVRKQSKVAETVNQKIKEFAEAQVAELEACTNGVREEVAVESFKSVLVDTPTKPAPKQKVKTAASGPKIKTSTHKERKKQATTQKEDYPVKSGQEVKILTTANLTSVNKGQADAFNAEDKVKVARVYTNQFDDDVVEVIKQASVGLVKGVILLEDVEY